MAERIANELQKNFFAFPRKIDCSIEAAAVNDIIGAGLLTRPCRERGRPARAVGRSKQRGELKVRSARRWKRRRARSRRTRRRQRPRERDETKTDWAVVDLAALSESLECLDARGPGRASGLSSRTAAVAPPDRVRSGSRYGRAEPIGLDTRFLDPPPSAASARGFSRESRRSRSHPLGGALGFRNPRAPGAMALMGFALRETPFSAWFISSTEHRFLDDFRGPRVLAAS